MEEAKSRKKVVAVVLAVMLAVAAVAAPAYAFYHVHAGDYAVAEDVNGAMEICATVDATALGETVWTGLIFIPASGSPADVLAEMPHSSESQSGLEAIHNYDYISMAEYVAEGTWECRVYPAESQNPGTQTTHDTEGTLVEDLDSYTLQRYDNVVFTAK